MHEFSFAYNIFKVAEATAIKYNAKKISEVYLEIGFEISLSHDNPAAFTHPTSQ